MAKKEFEWLVVGCKQLSTLERYDASQTSVSSVCLFLPLCVCQARDTEDPFLGHPQCAAAVQTGRFRLNGWMDGQEDRRVWGFETD